MRAANCMRDYGTTNNTPAHQAPPVWRAPEGLEDLTAAQVGDGGACQHTNDKPDRSGAPRGLRGLAAVPVGGGRAWPGFEIDHSERSSRVAISRAAGPDGARNTSGAASNKLNREFRLRRPWVAAGPGVGRARLRRGMTGQRADAPSHTSATRRRRCGGRRRVRRARAGFEIDHSEPLGSRVAISRAAGASGARNTSGATSNAGDQAGPQPQQAAPRAAAAQ